METHEPTLNELSHQQPYDNVLKRLLEGQPDAILPLLLADEQMDLKVEEELNIEVLLPPRRMDRIYRSSMNGKSVLIHVEFETSANKQMDRRLLCYHALLYERHKLPIYSVIVYPFEVTMMCSPLREADGAREILTFHYQTIALWRVNARSYIERGAIPLYGLLPTMDCVDKDLLLQAVEQMIAYYGENEARLREELLCFRILLQRAGRLKGQDLQDVLERINMLDPLLEQDPWFQGLQRKGLEEARKEGREEGREEGARSGELIAIRSSLGRLVRLRFPNLSTQANELIWRLDRIDILIWLEEQLILCASEQTARKLLQMPCPS